jgi:hypothetical protein
MTVLSALAACLAGIALFALAACPDPTEVGHAPKRQLDEVQRKVDAANAKHLGKLQRETGIDPDAR